ncbi:MAG: D-aminoacylase [Planctomycetales bacterium]|nr:D-aminoacylase [Planctomycetales bacterium]
MRNAAASLAVVSLLIATCSAVSAADEFDLVLRGGRIVDGTGAPWYHGDIAIRGGKIVGVGRLPGTKAQRTIDASELVVAPGFIDMMGQTAAPFLTDPKAAINLLTQGITTINCGEGVSDAPLIGDAAKQAGWSSMAEFFAKLEAVGMPINSVQTVGHTQVRSAILGDVDRRASPAELERMREHVREAMRAGAIGVSTALIYPPAVYAPTEEIIELTKVAGEFGGGYYTHMRNEGDRLLEAIDEALAIGAGAGTRVHIFHLKAAGQQNWGKMEQAIARIKAARAVGQQVTADVYPYINNGLGASAFIHPRHSAEGSVALRRKLDDAGTRAEIRREMETSSDYENWFRHSGFNWNRVVLGSMSGEPYGRLNGETISAIATKVARDPWDVFFDAARRDAFAMPQTMSEVNLILAMRQEFISFCTDVGPAGGSRIASHPRAAGSFPIILSRYVRDLGVLSLEQAVARMTSVAANDVLLHDRGRLAAGLPADLVVFDPAKVADRATFAEPLATSNGFRFVIVNGQVVLDDGRWSGIRPGRVLRGPGVAE